MIFPQKVLMKKVITKINTALAKKPKEHAQKNVQHHGFSNYTHFLDFGKDDISLGKILWYNLLFFIPIVISVFISFSVSKTVSEVLQVSRSIAAELVLIPLIFVVFFTIIPYIRQRENIRGVRLSLIGFTIIAVFMTLPPMFMGKVDFLLRQFIFIATYILLVFIYCPEVLGITGNLVEWFKKGKQITLIVVYVAIVLFYILGFAYLFFNISRDATVVHFDVPDHMDTIEFGDMAYYSIVTFSTIGYGDITPRSDVAKLVVSVEVFLGMLINILFIAILLVYVGNSQIFAAQKEERKIERKEKEIEKEEEKIERKLEREEKEIEEEEEKIKRKEKRIKEEIKPTRKKTVKKSSKKTHAKITSRKKKK
jgi:ABC-type multidrug transport system fused ATPase/permease subunit